MGDILQSTLLDVLDSWTTVHLHIF